MNGMFMISLRRDYYEGLIAENAALKERIKELEQALDAKKTTEEDAHIFDVNALTQEKARRDELLRKCHAAFMDSICPPEKNCDCSLECVVINDSLWREILPKDEGKSG